MWQGFRSPEEVQRFSDMMEEMCYIVATKHSGSLKASSPTLSSPPPMVSCCICAVCQLKCLSHAGNPALSDAICLWLVAASATYHSILIMCSSCRGLHNKPQIHDCCSECQHCVSCRVSTAQGAMWLPLWRWSGAARPMSSCGS